MKKPIKEKAIDIQLSKLVFGNIQDVKTYLKLDSYDRAVIVIKIMSESESGYGMSELQLVRELNFSRATMNRILNRLVDIGAIKVVPGIKPRRYVYNFNFGTSTYGDNWVEERDGLRKRISERCVRTLLCIFYAWRHSQFEKRD